MATQRDLIQDHFAKHDRTLVDANGVLLHTAETYVLRVLPGDITAVIRAVAIDELNEQVDMQNKPSQILVDGRSAGQRSIEAAMRRVQIRFQDIDMMGEAIMEIFRLLQQITRIQSPPQNAIVARNNFFLMIDGQLLGQMPQAMAVFNSNNVKPESVIRVVGPLVNYGRRLFWNPIGTSAKMKFRRVASKRTIAGVRFLSLRGADPTAPKFKPYSSRTLRKKANRTSHPAQTLQAMLSGATPPGRTENVGQIVKRLIKRDVRFRGLHFTDGWVEYAPAVGWSKLRNARVPAFGVHLQRKGQVG